MANELRDEPARVIAATDFTRDLLVEAGAGSGKTSLLVERLLQALLVEGAPLGRVAAISFTRKAAAELQDRLAHELGQVARIAGAAAAADPRRSSGRLWLRLEDEAVRRRAAARAEECLEHLDLAALGTQHAFCAALLHRHPLAAGLPPLFQPDDGKARSRLVETEAPAAVAAALEALPAGARALLAPFSEDVLARTAAAAVAQPAAPAPERLDEPYAALAALAAAAGARLRAALLRAGWLSMEEVIARARDLLEGNGEVRRRERARWAHLLVDEIQDTDPNQYRILACLALGADSGARPRLFLVGDPKQSIYRFRRADLSAYTRFRDQIGAEGAILTLGTNFRSRSRLLEPINLLFERAMQPQPGLQPPFQRIDPDPDKIDPAGTPARISLLRVGGSMRKDEARAREAAAVIENLRRRREQGAAWRDFLILLPRLTGLSILQEALQQAGVPFTVDGGKSFFKRQEVADFAALLLAWLGPRDDEVERPEYRPALLATLRSALGGVSDAELLRYRRAIGEAPFGAAPPDAAECAAVARFLARLGAWRSRLARVPVDQVPAALLRCSGLRAAYGARRNGAQAVANLDKAAAAIAAEIAELGSDLREAARRLADHLAGDEEADQGVSEENADAVGILTVHKAKGLERKVVFLCALDGGKLREERGFHLLAHEQRGYGIRIDKERQNALYRELAEEDRAHLTAEKLRLLYVALTRAREELILVHTSESDAEEAKNPWLRALEQGWGYAAASLAPEVDGVRFQACQPPVRDSELESPMESAIRPAALAVERWHVQPVAAIPRHGWPSALGHPPEPEDFRPGADEDRAPLARALGRTVHRAFEGWDYCEWDTLLSPLVRLAVEEAEDAQVSAAEIERRARSLLQPLRDSACGRHLLSLRTCARFPELPLLHTEGGTTYSGAIDLLYRDCEGRYAVADFKSDAGLDAEAARARYAAQLQLYGAAVRSALELAAPPRLELLLLDHGLVVEVAPA